MEEPAILVVLIYVAIFFVGLGLASFLIWRVMTKPGAHIGSRLPEQPPQPRDKHYGVIPMHPEDIHPSDEAHPDASPGHAPGTDPELPHGR